MIMYANYFMVTETLQNGNERRKKKLLTYRRHGEKENDMKTISASFNVRFKITTDPYYPEYKTSIITISDIPLDEYGFYTNETYNFIFRKLFEKCAEIAKTRKITIIRYQRIRD